MKSAAPKTAGAARRLVPDRKLPVVACLVAGLLANGAFADSMYRYKGEDGEWIYSDRPPPGGGEAEVRKLQSREQPGEISVVHDVIDDRVRLTANNRFHAPIELRLEIQGAQGIRRPGPDEELHWVLPPESSTTLLDLPILSTGETPKLDYGYRYLPGVPFSSHRPPGPYRAPFASATTHKVTQAFPDVATHTTPDSHFAVDVSMPVGTDIFAARDGIVFDVASTHFSSGLDPARDGPRANVVRILHDDGTYAVYAHLNTNSIRVRPGQRVRRGDYIADSGNTGFSSGPHLHFVVLRNVGMRAESVPVSFEGQNSSVIVPATGSPLTAY